MTRVVLALCVLLSSTTARAQDDEEPPPKPGAKKKKAPAPPPDEDEPPKKKKAVDEDEPPKKKAAVDEDEPPKNKAAEDEERVEASASVSTGELIEVGGPKGRMTLPGGKFMLNLVVEANMAKSAAGKPVSVAPDLWIGLADRLTVGIYHSGRAATGFLSGFGTGLCFRGGGMGGGTGGASNPCKLGLGDVYTFVGGEMRIGLTEGGFATAFVLGGNARFLESEKLFAGKAGFVARIHGRRVAVEIAPVVFLGLNKREEVMGLSLNPDLIFVPLTIYLRFAPRFSLALQGGLSSTLKKIGDNYEIPAAAGLSFWVTKHLSFDAAFGLAAVADKNDMTKAFDQRSVTVGIGYAH